MSRTPSVPPTYEVTRAQLKAVKPCREGYKRVCKALGLTEDTSRLSVRDLVNTLGITEMQWLAELFPEMVQPLFRGLAPLISPAMLGYVSAEFEHEGTPEAVGGLVVFIAMVTTAMLALDKRASTGTFMEAVPRAQPIVDKVLRARILEVLAEPNTELWGLRDPDLTILET